METQKQLGFIDEAFSNIENLLKYADVLLQSGKLPKHFYELDSSYNYVKDAQGKFRVNANLLVTVIQFGLDMNLSVSNSIRHLIPLGGTIALKGDMARAMIFASGKIDKWEESTTGTYEEGNISYTITASRKDGIAKTYTFTADDAKRMGLWVSPERSEKHEYFKRSPWFKTPVRMCMYRCLGFISRDLFADVLNGVYLAEEALDLEEDNTEYKTESGIVVKPGKEEKVEKANAKVVEQIKEKDSKRRAVVQTAAEANQPEPTPEPQSEKAGNLNALLEGRPEQSNDAYAEEVKKMAPLALVAEFGNTMPFSIDIWVKCGGKKDARTIVPLLIAANAGMDNLRQEVELRGVNWDAVLNG